MATYKGSLPEEVYDNVSDAEGIRFYVRYAQLIACEEARQAAVNASNFNGLDIMMSHVHCFTVKETGEVAYSEYARSMNGLQIGDLTDVEYLRALDSSEYLLDSELLREEMSDLLISAYSRSIAYTAFDMDGVNEAYSRVGSISDSAAVLGLESYITEILLMKRFSGFMDISLEIILKEHPVDFSKQSKLTYVGNLVSLGGQSLVGPRAARAFDMSSDDVQDAVDDWFQEWGDIMSAEELATAEKEGFYVDHLWRPKYNAFLEMGFFENAILLARKRVDVFDIRDVRFAEQERAEYAMKYGNYSLIVSAKTGKVTGYKVNLR
jgi:hypothetical protein